MSIENFANVLIGLSAVAGAAIAGIGLNSWKNQKNWEIDHDLAKRLLVLLFKYRDAIQDVRNPAIYSNEQGRPSEDQINEMSPDQVRFFGISTAYENRWSKVQELRSNLYADATEAEAYWGKVYKELFRELTALEIELAANIRAYLTASNPDVSQGMRTAYEEILRSKRDVMYALYNEDDVFAKEFEASLAAIEAYLRDKMGQGR